MTAPDTPRISLRLKIFLTFTLLTVITVSLVGVLVSRRFTEEMRANLANSIRSAAGVYQSFTGNNIDQLINQARDISLDARLRASVSTMDSSTIAVAIEEINQTYLAPLFVILDSDDELLAGYGVPPGYAPSLPGLSVVIDAMNGYESGDILAITDTLMMVAAIPILPRTSQQGILLLGAHMDQDFLNRLQGITGCELTFVVNGHIPHSTYPAADEAQHTDMFASMITNEGTWDFSIDNDRFLGTVVQITNVQGMIVGSLFVYKSLDEALVALGPLRWSIFLIALGSLALLLLFSYLLARGVTRSVEDLTTAVRRFSGGHYDTPIRVTSNDEVGTLALAFEEMRQSLHKAQEELLQSERLSTVGSMANGIIHDFKQPINTIQGFTELLQLPGTSPDKRKKYGDQILSTIRLMLGMVNDLLDYARGETRLHLSPASLNDVVDQVVSRHQSVLKDKRLELTFEPGDIDDMVIDHHRMRRVVDNLLSNARDAVGEAGRISVATVESEGGVELTISDTGGGIPREIQDRLFEPFVTLGKQTGTGLGLAITRKVIEEHGGKISFTTKENEGTTFRVWLPTN